MDVPAVLLDVRNLRTYFSLDQGTLKAVDGVSFAVPDRARSVSSGRAGAARA